MEKQAKKNRILQDIGVITNNTYTDKDNIKLKNQIFNCYSILTTQPQEKSCKAKNLPYIQVMINDKPTHFVIDTGAS